VGYSFSVPVDNVVSKETGASSVHADDDARITSLRLNPA
jgi:hypothetical protein